MIFVPIIAGWALGVTSAKLVDTQRSRALLTDAAKSRVSKARVVPNTMPIGIKLKKHVDKKKALHE